MTQYQDKTWEYLRDSLGAVYEDLELTRCVFSGCHLGQWARRPADRTIVRRVRATRCAVDGGMVGPVLFEDVQVTNLRTAGNLGGWLSGALFKHVILAGKIGGLVLDSNRWIDPLQEAAKTEVGVFRAAERDFYASTDWALDIRGAELRSLDWRLDIPIRLVRRDPETQVVVKQERALEGAWRKIPLEDAVVFGLEDMLRRDQAERIFAAPRASKRFKDELASLALLRKEGIAEPD